MTQPDLIAIWESSHPPREAPPPPRPARVLLGARANLGGQSLGAVFEALFAALLLYVTGNYFLGHLDNPWLATAAAVVYLHLVAAIWTGAMEILRLNRLDWSLPITQLQADLLRIQRWKFRCEKWLLLAGLFTWLPAMLMLLAMLGIDLLVQAAVPWILANLVLGAVLFALLNALARRYVEVDAPGPRGLSVLQTFSGRRLARALAALAELQQFRSDPDAEADFLR